MPVLNEERLPRVELSVAGRHNMFNAMFALGLAHVAGADLAGACAGISEFVGVRRRFELHEGAGGGVLVNDYAHHPVEIEAVLQTARRRFPDRRLVVAFQPHQYQRTLLLMESFAASLVLGALALHLRFTPLQPPSEPAACSWAHESRRTPQTSKTRKTAYMALL